MGFESNMIGALIRIMEFRHSDRDTGRRDPMTDAQTGVMQLQARPDGIHQKLE